MILGFLAGLRFGIVGVAIGYAVSYLCFVLPATLFFLARVLDERPPRLWGIFARPALIAAVLAAALLVFRSCETSMSEFGALAAALGITLAAGAGCGYCLYRREFRWLLEKVRKDLTKR
jgi:O-antigen/teichoic acid export membrane protein